MREVYLVESKWVLKGNFDNFLLFLHFENNLLIGSELKWKAKHLHASYSLEVDMELKDLIVAFEC